MRNVIKPMMTDTTSRKVRRNGYVQIVAIILINDLLAVGAMLFVFARRFGG